MSQNTDLLLDPRSAEDLRRELAAMAASYTPEWRFNPASPDIGTALALIFADQTQDNIRRLNQVMDKLHTEFVNLLGISLLPAVPASGVAVIHLIRDTVPGLPLPKGTKLHGQTMDVDGETVVFETLGDVYITSAQLTDILSISGRFGKIIPILGGPKPVQLLPPTQTEPQGEPPAAGPGAIALFDFSAPGVERFAALLYHRSVFHTDPGVEILVQPTGTGSVSAARTLADRGRYRWSYVSDGALVPFDTVEAREDTLVLCREGEPEPLSLAGDAYGLVTVEAVDGTENPVTLTELRLSSACDSAAPAFLCHNDQDLDSAQFLPFGDSASLFDECFIGHDRIFTQEDALITLRFDLSFRDRLVTLTPKEQADNLKIIKRKPRIVPFETASTVPQEIALDYFNGLGWRKLPCLTDWTTLFDGEHPGAIALAFRCPSDWRSTTVGGYNGRCIRLRITRADNCYLLPCVHKMPVVTGLSLSYYYDGPWKHPHLLQSVRGTQILDLTPSLMEHRPVTLFEPLPYPGNALYLGFDRRPEGAPISLLFDVAESVHFQSAPITFEYSSYGRWKPLKVVDGTQNMASAGTILFLPPADMAPMAVEGVVRHWLRLVDADNVHDDPNRHHPDIRAIYLNAVEICNRETLEEEQFYIQAPSPNMTFPIAAENILSAEVFVNEKDRLSQAMMAALLADRPDDVRCTYNFLGEIDEFFVRWSEVDHFDGSAPTDRHYVIDRLNNTISFGDGVHVMIPTARSAVAFTLRAVCCKGGKGNLPAGAVHSMRGRPLYVDTVYNPIATYAGSNIESLPSAHLRGANLLSGRGRLMSSLDFVREVRSFSGAIHKVRCITGMDLSARKRPDLVSIIVMMRDYADGSYSFNSIKHNLRQRLLDRCEATLDPSCLILSEPVYVSISLTVWAETEDAHRSFDLQNLIRETVDDFLDPLGSAGGRGGWDIGRLPTTAQLGILLHALRGPGRIDRFLCTARYTDHTGTHELDLDRMPHHPFVIGVPGTHRIYVELPTQR